MTLLGVIGNLGGLDDADTIYAKVPWSSDSLAVVAREPAEGGVPEEATGLGLAYFLEVSIAREVLDGLPWLPTPETKCERIIHYAVHDA